MVGLNDRLFLTGALRIDGASTFGQNYNATLYPKAGLSWLLSAKPFFPRIPGLGDFRVRYAFGASGQQPLPEWSRPEYRVTQGFLRDELQDVIGLSSLGNPDLRPERVREHEFGFDASGFDGRLQFGVAWYRRSTADQIVQVPIAAGYGSRFTNLGLTTQHGFEAEVSANLIAVRSLRVDMKARHSSSRTKLVDLGGGTERRVFFGGFAEGHSLGARFLPTITYEDADGNGLLASSEVQLSPRSEWLYAGESVPPVSQALTTIVSIMNGRVRISTLVELRAGFMQENRLRTSICGQLRRCLEMLDPQTPLKVQAEIAAILRGQYMFLERGDYVRLREVAIAFDLPGLLGWRSATVSLSGRNLGLWTAFSGPDVESSDPVEGFHAGGIPQGRTWTARIDIGY